jgi:hypothetical protein
MTDLETLLTRVWSRDTRPLVEEAWRCYNAGGIRASIAATWTAITADITAKLVLLADDGDAGAIAFRAEVASAQWPFPRSVKNSSPDRVLSPGRGRTSRFRRTAPR